MGGVQKKSNPFNKKTIAIGIIGASALGWAVFRPELLFINKKVNEAIPLAANETASILAKGEFVSGAHETKGMAQLVSSGGKTYVRLTDFNTSNGPDVRVIALTKSGNETAKDSIDLGSIKGNIGDQNYELPNGVDPTQITSISIWCKRFSVGFGSAMLNRKMAVRDFIGTNVAFGETVVTSGKWKGASAISGKASIIENDGKRVIRVQLNGTLPSNSTLKLVKRESLMLGSLNASIAFINLGAAAKGTHESSIPKDIDLWLYRSVALVQNGKVIAFVNLRSSQEKPGAFVPASLELA